jgi:hypothetical protein
MGLSSGCRGISLRADQTAMLLSVQVISCNPLGIVESQRSNEESVVQSEQKRKKKPLFIVLVRLITVCVSKEFYHYENIKEHKFSQNWTFILF